MLKPLIDWYLGALDGGGYPLIVLLMAIESSFVPLPSELIIPPAAILAHNHGRFSMWGIVLAGTVGSWLGAAAMYWMSRWLGRPILLRFGKYFFVTEEKIQAAERWARHFGSAGVLIARLLPVVRHLIGIPMGMVRMDFRFYSLFTVLGSAAWCSVLCWVGVVAGNDPELLQGNLRRITLWFVIVVAVLAGLYVALVRRYMKRG